MSRETVKLSDTAKTRLEDYRDRHEHTSFDSAVRDLLTRAETPLPTDGIASDTVPKDALRVAEHFNIADRVYPLPTVASHALGELDHCNANSPDDAPSLTHKFRLYIAGHWLLNGTTASRPNVERLPHFDAYTHNGSFLFKLCTYHNTIHHTVGGLPEGEFWFALDDDAPYEDSVLAVIRTDGTEFLAPPGGIPDRDAADSLPPFGGYDGYWDDPDGPEYTEEFHGLRTIPEFLGDDGLRFFAQQLEHDVRATGEFQHTDLEDADTFSPDINEFAVPADLAVRLNIVPPTMTIDHTDDDIQTVGDLLDVSPKTPLTIPFMPQVRSPLQVLAAFTDTDNWHVNPNDLDAEDIAIRYRNAARNLILEFGKDAKADDAVEEQLDEWADDMRPLTDNFPDPETIPTDINIDEPSPAPPISLYDHYYMTVRYLRIHVTNAFATDVREHLDTDDLPR